MQNIPSPTLSARPVPAPDPIPRIPALGLSINETSAAAGVSRNLLYREIAAGRLKSFKVGKRRLISPAALEKWVRAREQAASAEQPGNYARNPWGRKGKPKGPATGGAA